MGCMPRFIIHVSNWWGTSWRTSLASLGFQTWNQPIRSKQGLFDQWETFIYLKTVLSVNYSFQNHLNRKKDRWIFEKAQIGRYHVMLFDHLSDFSAAFHRHPNHPLHRNRHYRHLEYDEIPTLVKFWLTPPESGGSDDPGPPRIGFGVILTNNDNRHGKIWSLHDFMFRFLKICYRSIC